MLPSEPRVAFSLSAGLVPFPQPAFAGNLLPVARRRKTFRFRGAKDGVSHAGTRA